MQNSTYTNYTTFVLLLGLKRVSGMDLLVVVYVMVVTCGSIICGHAEKDKTLK